MPRPLELLFWKLQLVFQNWLGTTRCASQKYSHICVPKQQVVNKVGGGNTSLHCLPATMKHKTTRKKVTTTNM